MLEYNDGKNNYTTRILGDRWIIIIILIITGLTLWNSKDLLLPFSNNEGNKDINDFESVNSRDLETYTGFDFTFKYPQGMSFREDNFGDSIATIESGFLQGMISEDPLFAYMEVFWNETDAYQNAIMFIDNLFQRYENSPDEIISGEKFNFTSEKGRELFCRFYNVNDRCGTFFKGVLGSWQNTQNGRYFIVTYLSTENLEDYKLTDYLETLIDSLDVT